MASIVDALLIGNRDDVRQGSIHSKARRVRGQEVGELFADAVEV